MRLAGIKKPPAVRIKPKLTRRWRCCYEKHNSNSHSFNTYGVKLDKIGHGPQIIQIAERSEDLRYVWQENVWQEYKALKKVPKNRLKEELVFLSV